MCVVIGFGRDLLFIGCGFSGWFGVWYLDGSGWRGLWRIVEWFGDWVCCEFVLL